MGFTVVYESTPEIDAAEAEVKRQLAAVDRVYLRMRQPLIDELARLHGMKKATVVTPEYPPRAPPGAVWKGTAVGPPTLVVPRSPIMEEE